MSDEAILENGVTLNSVPKSYKNQKMYNKVVDNYLHVLESDSKYYKIKKICDKSVNTYSFTIKFVPECFMTQEICDKVVNRKFDSIPNQYKTKKVYDRVVS